MPDRAPSSPAANQRLRFTEESEPVPDATITLVEGASFVICNTAGDIVGGGVEGLFVGDTRVCSALAVSVDGERLEPLTVTQSSPFEAMFVARSRDRTLLVFRTLHVGRGLRIDLGVRNLTPDRRPTRVELTVGTDLADLFAVKEGRVDSPSVPSTVVDEGLELVGPDRGRGLVLRTGGRGEPAGPGGWCWTADLEPRSEWSGCVELAAIRAGEEVQPRFRCGEPPAEALPATRQQRWEREVPRVESDIGPLAAACEKAAEDLGGLRLFDPDHPDDALIAAGAPWFMTLFGRDSILTSWMALLLDPGLALSTVSALARLQGRVDDPSTEEQPGRILHEVRFSAGASLALSDGDVYYGSVDATPLFVMLVHELWRWGTPLAELKDLLPAVDAALAWMAGPGDADGDGYIEYAPSTETSLVNQGWKDSFDGISYADGRLPEPPIALAEVQGYAYAAWRAGAALATAVGDHVAAAARAARAETLQTSFERDFWLPERDALAVGLDADKRPIDSVASNMGHCLWTGIVSDRAKSAAIARWLVSPEMFTGWGLRTLATTMGRYNPLSYHNGSVWPHDTAIAVAGLRRAGHAEEAMRLAGALLAAASASGGRLPELFAGLSLRDVPTPVPYPASCSPQAWASAAPLLVLRALLGWEPDVAHGAVSLDPVLPAGATRLRVENLPLGPHRVTIDVDGDSLAVRGLPRSLSLLRPAEG